MQKRLSDRVADDILTMIVIEKRFLPGEKLPNEIELSGELEISRTTLREALCILVANGVVEMRRGISGSWNCLDGSFNSRIFCV